MPLTFAHPAAVLPLFRGPLIPMALVAGALAPDIPYFLRATPIPVSAQAWWEPFFNATTTHSWPGMFTVAVPLALALYVALVACERPARWAVSPTKQEHKNSVGPHILVTLSVTAVSLVLGVATHVLWDSFTHSDGWFVQHIAALRAIAFGEITWARLLQHISTAVGLFALMTYLWRRRKTWHVTLRGGHHRLRWIAGVLVIGMLCGAAAVVVLRHESGSGVEVLFTNLAVGVGIGGALTVASLSLLWWVWQPFHRSAMTHDPQTGSSS